MEWRIGERHFLSPNCTGSRSGDLALGSESHSFARMTGRLWRFAIGVVIGVPVGGGATCMRGAEYPALGLDIFVPGADGELLIDAALEKASAEKKRVLLMFGTNRSVWSRRLHDVFESDPDLLAHLRRDFVWVKIDVNRKKDPRLNTFTDERFDRPTRLGIPALVLLDAAGEKLAEQDTGELENADKSGYERAKLLALFAAWAPPREAATAPAGTAGAR